jgi:hypothetical protein
MDMSYNKYDYGYTLQTDYNVVGGPAVSGTVTMTLDQFEELQSGFEERVEAIFDRKLKEVFGDD